MNIVLVTYFDEGKYSSEGSSEDSRLQKYLSDKELRVTYKAWTDTTVQWGNYDAVILKSPWDYFDKVTLFRTWLEQLDKAQVPVLNPTNIVRWNLDKSYLLNIEAAGFAIIPTQIIPQHGQFNAASFFEQWHTNTILVKPAISGGAKNTFLVSKTEVAQLTTQVNELLKTETLLVQPFMPEIQTEGEWSMVYFNGIYSHCVLKVAKSGDFRVQHFFGGEIRPVFPPASLLDYGQKLVQQFAPGCLYARVDGLVSKGAFKLMELELIEPLLYLQENNALYENYYQALTKLI